jgi:hypothetical protein
VRRCIAALPPLLRQLDRCVARLSDAECDLLGPSPSAWNTLPVGAPTAHWEYESRLHALLNAKERVLDDENYALLGDVEYHRFIEAMHASSSQESMPVAHFNDQIFEDNVAAFLLYTEHRDDQLQDLTTHLLLEMDASAYERQRARWLSDMRALETLQKQCEAELQTALATLRAEGDLQLSLKLSQLALRGLGKS